MPPNFGVLMNAQQLADLTAFLVSCKDKAKKTATPPKLETEVQFEQSEGQVAILINGQNVGTYVHSDPVTMRPFFKNIRTLERIQVTRNHPPIEGVDDGDHASMHPGIWMAFGDISGSDFCRNRARVVHERFITRPSGGKSFGSFSVSNRFETTDGKLICRQVDTHNQLGWGRLAADVPLRVHQPGRFLFWRPGGDGAGRAPRHAVDREKGGQTATALGSQREVNVGTTGDLVRLLR